MALHELQVKKLSQMFRNFDRDADGFVAMADHEAIALQAIALRKLEPTSSVAEQILAGARAIGRSFEERVDTDGDGRVSLDEWLTYYEAVLAGPDDIYRATILGTTEMVLNLCDTDGDGALSNEELNLFLSVFRIQHPDPKGLFARLDSDGDGEISKGELMKHLDDWHRSTEVGAAANDLAGPV